MNLEPSEEEAAVADLFEHLLERECPTSRVRSAEPLGHDGDLWSRMTSAGALDMAVPAERGGSGVGIGALGRVAEACGRRLAPVPFVETVTATRLLARCHEPEVDAILEACLEGSIATLAPEDLGLRSVVLPAGAVARFVVGRVGGDVWCWDLASAPLEWCDNLGSLPAATVDLGDLDRLSKVRLFAGDEAWYQWRDAWTEWRLLTAHALTGAGTQALSIGVNYTKDRVQFEQPIACFQAVQHRFADAATELRGCQLLCYKAAWAADSHHPSPSAGRLAILAYLAAAREAFRAASEALHFHGGYGFTLEYDIQLYFRRVKAWPLIHESFARSVSTAARLVIGDAKAQSLASSTRAEVG